MSSPNAPTTNTPNEETLRRQLTVRLHNLTRLEPLPGTYKHLLFQSPIPPPQIPKDPLYAKKVTSDLRQCVEKFLCTGPPPKKGLERDDLDDDKMRAAFTLRECERHKQEGLLKGMVQVGDANRKRTLEGIAVGLQEREKKRALALERQQQKKDTASKKKDHHLSSSATSSESKTSTKLSLTEKVRKLEEQARLKALESQKRAEQRSREIEDRERERQRERLKERERQREIHRKKEEEAKKVAAEKAREEALRKAREKETPQQALHRLYQPIFKVLWDMEFANLNYTNPFRIVYDKDNCAAMGVPDYTDVVKQPMNLTYIREKVEQKSYETLHAFFADVELMISNALLYNSDPNNMYHLAAKEMKKKYKKMAKRVLQSVHAHQQQQKDGGK